MRRELRTLWLACVCAASVGAGGQLRFDASLIDETGKAVHFAELIKGRSVAINFIFTRCTSICLPMSGTFARVEKLLGADKASLISISIDPDGDTPERLAEWKRRFGGGPAWTLLSGKKAEIDRLAKALGAFAPDRSLHSPSVIVLHEPSGRMLRVNGLGGAEVIVRALNDVSHPTAETTP